MKTKITDFYDDYLEVERGTNGLMVNAHAPRTNRHIGFLFDTDEVRKLRDACNEFLGEDATNLRPISFGGGGNTVVIVNDKPSRFVAGEADTLRKLIHQMIIDKKL